MAQGQSWTTAGMNKILDLVFKQVSANIEDMELFFFSNDFTPSSVTVDANLTEITDNGLAKITLDKDTFDVATLTGSISYSRYNGANGIISNITGNQDCYGWALRGATTDVIYYAKNFGLKSFANSDTFTMNPVSLRMEV